TCAPERGRACPDRKRLDSLLTEVGLEAGSGAHPVAMSERIRDLLREEIESRSLSVLELTSGAGHDAGVLAASGGDPGVLFGGSRNGGVSHSPEELCSEEDVGVAVEVLTGALARLG